MTLSPVLPSSPVQLLFLPGASGNPHFWEPVAGLLTHRAERVHAGWPGFGPTAPDPEVNGIDDLVARVTSRIDQPTAIIAQSMGGIIAMRAALDKPSLVTHLVLTVTSGGIDVGALGGADWRAAFMAANPATPDWFAADRQDWSARLGEIRAKVLLLWGDAVPISPVAVGRRLAALLPSAALHIIARGTHELAVDFAPTVAQLIDHHFAAL